MPKTRQDVKPWQDESTIRHFYVREDLSLKEVGEALGCSRSTVSNWVNKFDIPTKEGRPAPADELRDEDYLRELYWDRGLSLAEIADQLDCYHASVRRWMQKHDIPRRDRREALPTGEDHPQSGLGEQMPDELDDKTWLETEYVEKKRSSYDIASSLGVHPGTVVRYLRKQSIDVRPRGGGGGDHHPNRVERETTTCTYCDGKIQRVPSLMRDSAERNFCNRQCRREYHMENRVARSCAYCGADVPVRPNRVGRSEHKFCNTDCFNQWLRETDARAGENNPMWKPNTIRGCGPNWEQTRQEARDRDGYTCQGCGMTEEAHKDEFGTELIVHHIQPRAQFATEDGVKWEQANALSNLASVCARCHVKWEQIAPLRPVTGDEVTT